MIPYGSGGYPIIDEARCLIPKKPHRCQLCMEYPRTGKFYRSKCPRTSSMGRIFCSTYHMSIRLLDNTHTGLSILHTYGSSGRNDYYLTVHLNRIHELVACSRYPESMMQLQTPKLILGASRERNFPKWIS
jgi:hypothetical protein